MEKEFVPYELAVKLKALGFDERCLTYYENEVPKIYNDILGWDFNSSFLTFVAAPLYQQAFRWFREKYELFGSCGISNFADKTYGYVITSPIHPHYLHNVHSLKSMEEAELAYLTKLIKIVETKSE